MTPSIKTKIFNIPEVSIDEVEKIAIKAGEILRNNYQNKIINSYASSRSVVADTGRIIENMLKFSLEDLSRCGFYSETKNGEVVENGLQWIVDPIDGRENILGYPPLMAISIGLISNRKPVLGVIYDPIHNQLFSAKSRSGAWLNGKTIEVSQKKDLADIRIGLDFSKNRKSVFLNQLKSILEYVETIKVFGSPVLNMAAVACGKLDLYFSDKTNIVDFVAGTSIVREAGGSVIDFDGKTWDIRSKSIIAGPKELVENFKKQIK